MFEPPPSRDARCRVLYISPLKALAADIDRNLQAPLAGIARSAQAAGTPVSLSRVVIRTGDTPTAERARFQREAADILITTPESLFLLLTSNARDRLASIDTVIVDEIHALVPTKRGAHLALSLERLEALRAERVPAAPADRPLRHPAAPRRGRAVSRGRQAAAAHQAVHRGAGAGTPAGSGNRGGPAR